MKVEKQSDFTNFLRLLPHDLQCDTLLWAFAGNRDTAYLMLDEGVQDYGYNNNPNPGWFNDIEIERAYGVLLRISNKVLLNEDI